MATVTFVANGGTGTMAAQTAIVPTTLDTNTFVAPAGAFGFGAWGTTPTGGTVYFPGQQYDFSADITLYALWSYLTALSPNTPGGIPVEFASFMPMPIPTYGAPPVTFVNPGYRFLGWNTAADGSGVAYADGATFPFGAGAPATIYAMWRTDEDISRWAPPRTVLDTGLSVADINAQNPQSADSTTGGATGTAVASLASVAEQKGKIVVVDFEGYTGAANAAIALPVTFTDAVVIVSGAWTAAGLAVPTVAGAYMTVPAVGASITTVLTVVGV